ncbi:hypothetical protein [Thalassospira sp. HJ]|uniref:hypothetical protein n=1 Tax=Thalassospira sp. HJ TaxID=1616823 RepID=UPI001269D120|nr:hypothetical protein [Thalassospira sp. HJ]
MPKLTLETAQPTEPVLNKAFCHAKDATHVWLDAGIAQRSRVFLFCCPQMLVGIGNTSCFGIHHRPDGVPELLFARQGEDDMQVSNTIDCNGLSPAPTLLRIMQALVGREDSASPLNVLVGADCNCERLADSLGELAEEVQLASDAKQFARIN